MSRPLVFGAMAHGAVSGLRPLATKALPLRHGKAALGRHRAPRSYNGIPLRMARAARSATLVAALVLAAGGPAVLPARAASSGEPEAANPAALSVTVVRPRQETLTETLLVTGSLLPREEIEVGPEIEGHRLMEILVDAGDKVEKGQVLARLSREVLETQLAQNTASAAKARAAVAQQRAALDQVKATLTEASASVERARQLRKSGTASQETLDERERAVKVAAAQVEAAKESLAAAEAEVVFVNAQRDEVEVKLKRTDIRAPAAGVILSRSARIGAIALSARTEPLFRIAENGAIDLDAEVPEDMMPRMKEGLAAEVTPAGFDAPLMGKVRLVSAEVDKASRLGRVKIALPQDARLKPGAYGRGVIEIGRKDGFAVPQSAVMFDGDGAYVLVVKDGVVQERRVTPALKSAGKVLLSSGVGAEDDVVARAGGFLKEGDKVTPVAATAASEVR